MSRNLGFEPMEARRLLAADFVGPVAESTFKVADGTVDAESSDIHARSLIQFGSVQGTVQSSGHLGWFNRYDVFSFRLDHAGDLRIELAGLRANADLYLTNEAGQLVDYSVARSTTTEIIDLSVDAGQYHAWAVGRSFWYTPYQLTVTAEWQPPPQIPGPEQPGQELDTPPLENVAYFGSSREWNINEVGAPESWAAGYTGQGVTVAVIDTGVDLDHPDLRNSLYVNPGEIPGNGIDDDANGLVDDISGYDFAGNDPFPDDRHGHGTHVAGTIAAGNNGYGATGVAPDAKILPIRVLGDNGSGTSFDVAAGIRYAADMGADIINLSLGGGYSQTIESAVRYAESAGSLIVAASGNEYASMPGFPARFSGQYDNVLSVGAFDSAGRTAAFSNRVGASGAVQVDAPGVSVFSTYPGSRYAWMSGTSMAAPHVAAVAALTLSADPSLSASELRNLLVAGVSGSGADSDSLGRAETYRSVALAAAGAEVTGGESAGSDTNGSESGSVRAAGAIPVANDSTKSDAFLSVPRLATNQAFHELYPDLALPGSTPVFDATSDGETLSANSDNEWAAIVRDAKDKSDSQDPESVDFALSDWSGDILETA